MNPAAASRPAYRILLALLLPGVAACLQGLCWPVLRPLVWFLFYPAVFISPWIGGFGPGLAATALASGLAWWFFMPPVHVLLKPNPASYLNAALFLFMGGLFAYVHDRLHRATLSAASAREAENQATFQQAAIGIAHLNPDGSWVRVNQRFCEILGYSREELLAVPYRQVAHPDDLELDREMARRMLAGDFSRKVMEKRFIRKDGSTGWMNLGLSLVRTTGNLPDFFIAVAEDIGPRKLAEEALRERDDLLNRTSRLAQVGAWEFDPVSLRGAWSQEVARIHDLDPSLPVDVASGLRYYQEEDRPVIARAVELAITEGLSYDLELRLVSAAGVPKWVRTIGSPVFAEGRVVKVHGALQDITLRKRMEVALRDSEARYRAIFEQAGVGVVEVDAATGRFLRVNTRFCAILGYAEAELLALGFQQVTHPGDLERDLLQAGRVSEGELPVYSVEKRYLHKDGSTVWGALTTRALLQADGRAGTRVSIVEDITARKQAELEVQQLTATLERRVAERTAELQAANAELESFAYAVSHDLRAPLRAMAGFSSALVEDCGPSLSPEAKEDLDHIIEASLRMGGLIDALLKLSRTTRCDMERVPVDLSSLGRAILADLARSEPDRRVQTRVEPGIRAEGDPHMLEAALANLLGNAWKYTSKTPGARIDLATDHAAGVRRIRIQDNGCGFDMAHSEKLFKPFQRLHRQDEFPGLGIGLATAQRIVLRHGGTLEAASAPGEGAVFFLCLPEPSLEPS